MAKRIGVLGGSFDPLHYGHLILAEQIRQEADLDKVLLVPAYVNPFKEEVPPADGHHRLEMLRLAAGDHPFFGISDIELKREGPSYTYDTLAALKERDYPDDDLFFIMGTDSFYQVEHWHKAEELICSFGFLIGMRKGYDEEELKATIARLKEKYPLRAEYIRIPELEISSTDIKQRIRDGKSVRFLLPDPVISYIREEDLYLDLIGRVREYARSHEKTSRFAHTQGVVKMAKELALRWGEDTEKAEIAAWFHDVRRPAGNLEHGPAAAQLLQKLFGVEDEDILNAIRYHTTGRPGMSRLEMVLKTADQLEEGRDYPGVEEMRAFTALPPEECVLRLMTHTKAYVLSIGGHFDPMSDEAIAWLKHKIDKETIMDNKEIALRAAKLLDSKKARDISIIDIAEKSGFADYFVIATAGSSRQIGALCDEVEDGLAKENIFLDHKEGKGETGWVLLDYGDVIVNLFTEEQRDRYQIEKVWIDCPQLEFDAGAEA